MSEFPGDKFALCYVEPPFAYFTTRELTKQWGDDWDDAPYEHNAGEPYEPHDKDRERGEDWQVWKLAYEAQLETPADRALCGYSPYSVQEINAGAVAWLVSSSWDKESVAIQAGCTVAEFVKAAESVGGTVYLPKEKEDGDE